MKEQETPDYDRGKAVGVKIGERNERKRILTLLEQVGFTWHGEKENLDIGKTELIALIKGESK